MQERDPRSEAAGQPSADPHVALAGLSDGGADEDPLERVSDRPAEEKRCVRLAKHAMYGRGPGCLARVGSENDAIVEVLGLFVAQLLGGLARADADFRRVRLESGFELPARAKARAAASGASIPRIGSATRRLGRGRVRMRHPFSAIQAS